jgi:hypothetical protein
VARLVRDPRYSGGLKSILPKGAHRLVDAALRRTARWNQRRTKRIPMDPSLQRQLRIEFAPEVAKVGALLGRDLGEVWHSTAPTATQSAREEPYAS